MSLFFYKKENNWVCVFCILMAILNISSYKNEHKNLEKFLQSMNLF